MTDTLTVSSGQTYTVAAGTTETHDATVVDGILKVEGELILSPDVGAAGGDQGLFGPLVLYKDRDEELLNPPNLYVDLVRGVTVSQPIALLFAGIILGFLWGAIKLRSVVVGGLWLFMVIAFVLAILVDTSLVFFWIAVSLGSVGLVLAIVESSR